MTSAGVAASYGTTATQMIVDVSGYFTGLPASAVRYSAYGWGNNFYGELGDDTTVDRGSPSQVGTDVRWDQVVAGDYHTVAINTGGTLWAWGQNPDGELGGGTTTDRSHPERVGNDNHWLR